MKAKCMPAFLLPTSESYRKYFSDDICDSLDLIEADYGLKGFAVVIKLWQKIYGSNEGYYCQWNDKVCSLFAKKIGASKGFVFEIVNRMIKEDIFDAELYEKYGILTSEWIQQNWADYMKRRPNAKIENAYLLINCNQKSEIANKNSKIANKKSEIANKKDITEQNLTKHNITMSSDEQKLLTDEQYNELVSLSSRQSVDKYISKILSWQSKTGKHCNDPFETIRIWIGQDKKQLSKSKKETSYDLDAWERYAMNFDPTMAGGSYD